MNGTLNHKLAEQLLEKDFTSLTKEEQKVVQKYNSTKQSIESLDWKIEEFGFAKLTEKLYYNYLPFIDISKYNVKQDGAFFILTK